MLLVEFMVVIIVKVVSRIFEYKRRRFSDVSRSGSQIGIWGVIFAGSVGEICGHKHSVSAVSST